ncbi:hypothetical protein [Micrococcus luteus]|uniref:hypothetical protein n=1 Tax=Micrococcus luteus TaxID=1270 RepID=UPI003316DBCE
MGYQLRRWLADHLPAGLSSGERLVALEIADQANDQTRRAYGSELRATILRRTGYANEKQLGKVLTKLAKNGVEMRVPIRDKHGEPVRDSRGRVMYACNGHEASEFMVPRLSDLPSCPEWGTFLDEAAPERSPERGSKEDEAAPPDPEAAPDGGPSGVKVPRLVPKVPPAGHPSPQSPQENSSSLLSHERVVMETLASRGVTEMEMREIIRLIKRENQPRSLAPYVARMADNGDLPDLLARVRADAERRAARRFTPPPEPAPEPERSSTTPEERDAAIAAARDILQGLRAPQGRRGAAGPARIVRPRAAPETPPEVAADHAYLVGLGDSDIWWSAARRQLGDQAHRNEVTRLAAQLAREGLLAGTGT